MIPALPALRRLALHLGLAGALLAGGFAASPARAQSEASAALSLLPVASVVGSATAASATAGSVAGAAVVLPAALSVGGALLTVVAVDASARGTVYLLERASDGAQVSVEVSGRAASAAAHGVGTLVSCSVIGSGVILSAAGEVLAFIPNALGRALLHNEVL
ncbi:hypothetical protein PGB34_14410 [Xenophilus arseniciresistens]|uniref:Uncharacterized protein n=1 Tax=Xenophilus arseniciresistens TaxID=1283306 RepID=A0AAE3SZU7_9BURK|nr:hypothetical protein [Xenophilus arseniciresistens]MDA7417557.1 hypothetical protein [Xenophilus arseniciresistens]